MPPESSQPPFANQDTPSRVLYIAEIVDRIFGFMDRADNARNARVCDAWSDPALSLVWRDVNDLHAIFSVLVPMVRDHIRPPLELYRPLRTPSFSDWARFDKYTAFIRTLVYLPNEYNPTRRVTRAGLLEISHSRTRLHIFPRLRVLEWRPPNGSVDVHSLTPGDSFLFAHPGILSFSFSLPNFLRRSNLLQFMEDIPQRMPGLADIGLYTTVGVLGCEESTCGLIKKLPSLARLSLPGHFFTSRLAEVTSSLPALRLLMTRVDTHIVHEPVLNFTHDISESRYTSMETLHLVTSISNVTILLKVISSKVLSSLIIHSPETTPLAILQLLKLCANKHRKISTLCLSARGMPLECDVHPDLPNNINSEIMRPLMHLSNLTSLTVDHPWPLGLSHSAITSLLSSLPLLRKLSLNPEPSRCKTSNLGLDILPVIAYHCSSLEELGIFIDATLPPPLPDPSVTPCVIGFRKLQVLSLDVSVISKDATHFVAFYLSNLLPHTCQLSSCAWWITLAQRAELRGFIIAEERRKLWAEVNGLLSLLASAIQRERNQMGAK